MPTHTTKDKSKRVNGIKLDALLVVCNRRL
jgi:hypothetical protein